MGDTNATARRWTNPYKQMEDEELLELVMYGNRFDGEVDQAYETMKQRLFWRRKLDKEFIDEIIENKEYFEKDGERRHRLQELFIWGRCPQKSSKSKIYNQTFLQYDLATQEKRGAEMLKLSDLVYEAHTTKGELQLEITMARLGITVEELIDRIDPEQLVHEYDWDGEEPEIGGVCPSCGEIIPIYKKTQFCQVCGKALAMYRDEEEEREG